MCDLFGKSSSCCLLAASAVNVLEIFCQIFCLANFVQSEIYLIKAILLSPLRLLLLQQLCMIYVIYSTLAPRHCLPSLPPFSVFWQMFWHCLHVSLGQRPAACCLLPSACLNFTSYWLYYTRLSSVVQLEYHLQVVGEWFDNMIVSFLSSVTFPLV